MKVPLLDLAPQHQPLRRQLLDAFEHVLDNHQFILGPEVEKLEKSVAAYTHTRFAIGVSSGTDALLVALMALDIGPGDEVLTAPYSFFATAGVIARMGAKPVFVDIDPVTYNLDPSLIERAITPHTKAILPVHLFGQCADMSPLLQIAKKHHLYVVEDAAQSLGSDYKDGQKAGSLGNVGCFSFFPSKNLGAIGDAGVVTTQDESLADKIRQLRVHGSKPKYYHRHVGGNFRIDEVQAALLNVKFPSLDAWTRQRQQNAQRYEELFGKTDLVSNKVLELPKAVYASPSLTHYHIYNQFVIRARERERLMDFLKKEQIGSEVYYPVPLHLQECFKSLGYHTGDFPHAEQAARETLALPIYPGMSTEQQAWVVETIKTFFVSSQRGSVSR